MLDIHRYEIIDWDDPEIDPDPARNNLLHCQRAGHLGHQAELIVYQVLYEGPWAEIRFKKQTVRYAVVGVALSNIWLVLLNESSSRSDWLRPVSGWPAEAAEIREWERATGEKWRGKR